MKHQGVFDLSFLSMIPNMTNIMIFPKTDGNGRYDTVCGRFSISDRSAVSKRRGIWKNETIPQSDLLRRKSELLYEEEKIVIIFVGHMAELADQVRKGLKEKDIAVLL